MPRRNRKRLPLYETPTYRDLLARVGANVRRLRELRGWTQEECAYQCGDLAAPVLRRIEGASTNITAVTLARLADGLRVDVGALLVAGTPHQRRGPGRPKQSVVQRHDLSLRASTSINDAAGGSEEEPVEPEPPTPENRENAATPTTGEQGDGGRGLAKPSRRRRRTS